MTGERLVGGWGVKYPPYPSNKMVEKSCVITSKKGKVCISWQSLYIQIFTLNKIFKRNKNAKEMR